MPRYTYTMRGIRRIQAIVRPRPLRSPVSRSHLVTIRARLHDLYTPADAAMIWAAVTSAFFGLLRSSEFTSPSRTSYRPATLCVRHLSFAADRTRAVLRLPASKTDQFHHGADVPLHRLPSHLCPFSALRRFVRALPQPVTPGPLFRFSSGAFLTRADIVTLLRAVFPTQPLLQTHSFRIGGASALAAAGLPDYAIQVVGRWSSDSFLRYLRLPTADIRPFQQAMADVSRR